MNIVFPLPAGQGELDMAKKDSEPVFGRLISQINQDHDTRKHLFEDLEAKLEMPVVTVFTSFKYPVVLEDTDVDMVADVLQKVNLSSGIAMMISSPGGDGIAAERMINVCRNYSKTGAYTAIVPGKAKSAATLVCFGAEQITMGPTSELGPVDPQDRYAKGENVNWYSAYNVVESYDELFADAVKEKGNLEPYLQQLANYDAKDIKEYRSAIDLSKDISIRALESGMMQGTSRPDIEKSIQMFLTPEKKKAHGRPIFRDEAEKCGLTVEKVDSDTDVWHIIYELYIRTNEFVSRQVSKCIESKSHSFIVGPTN